MSQEEIRNAILADYNVMRKVYAQFNNFLDFYVNQLTKHYKFKFAFDGSVYGFEREWRKDGIMKLAQTGIVLNETALQVHLVMTQLCLVTCYLKLAQKILG